MSEASTSDLLHGIMLGAVGVGVMTGLAAIGVALWSGDNPMVVVSIGGMLCALVGVAFFLHQRRKQDAAANEDTG